jgi:zinc protease
MNVPTRFAIAVLFVAGVQGCGRGAAQSRDVLPGRTRPVLEHGWAHPRDIKFAPNQFRPPDVKATLFTTASGVRAYIVPSIEDPLVQVAAAMPLGRGFEPPTDIGSSELLSRLVQRDIDERLGPAFLGRLQVEQEMDATRISVVVPRGEWQQALTAVIEGLRQVRLDPATIDAYRTAGGGGGGGRQGRGGGGGSGANRPAVELARMAAAYPIAPASPGLTVRREAIAALAARALSPKAVVLGIGGNVTRQDVEQALQKLMAGWTPVATTATETKMAEGLKPTSERFRAIDEPGYTTWIAVGHPTPRIAPEHEAPVAVMTDILSIRLNIAVREIRGLANSTVFQMPATTRYGGVLHVRTGGRPESVAPLVRYAKEELLRIRDQAGLPTTEELEQVKGGLVLSQWQRSLDGARTASATYAIETVRNGSLERLLKWPEAVRAVTAEQVRSAAQRYIQPDTLMTVIIGQLDAVRAARHPRWPATLDELSRASRAER